MNQDNKFEKRALLVEREEDGTLTRDTVKRAMKAFRKRIKLLRLDDESSIGQNPLSKGEASTIMGCRPPEQYPPEIWEELAEMGKLRKAEDGVYELIQQ